MEIVDVLFSIFSLIIITCAVLTVTLKHVLHAAICLMGCLFATSALFLLMFAEFVALMQVMVYIGGVVIFMLYAILLTTDLGEKFVPISAPKRMLACVFSLVIAGLGSYILSNEVQLNSNPIIDYELVGTGTAEEEQMLRKVPTARSIGTVLLHKGDTGFLIPFEVISIILLAALMGAATIARRGKDEEQTEVQA